MTKSIKKVPFRKKIKDFLNGVGGLSATAFGLMTFAAVFGDNSPENAGVVIFASAAIAAIAFWLASTIKPKTFIGGSSTVVSGREW